jgi:hypothetical protein
MGVQPMHKGMVAAAAWAAALCIVGASDSIAAPDVSELLSRVNELNGKCHGGSRDGPATQKSCDARDQLVDQLKKQGWCYGDPAHSAQSMYLGKWQRCRISPERLETANKLMAQVQKSKEYVPSWNRFEAENGTVYLVDMASVHHGDGDNGTDVLVILDKGADGLSVADVRHFYFDCHGGFNTGRNIRFYSASPKSVAGLIAATVCPARK